MQTKIQGLYSIIQTKILKCCANIYFNKQCLSKKVIPKYAKVKFGNSSPAAIVTTKKAQITRIKDEIKAPVFCFVLYCIWCV